MYKNIFKVITLNNSILLNMIFKFLITFLAIISLTSGQSNDLLSEIQAEYDFHIFTLEFGRKYSWEEFPLRRELFLTHWRHIHSHNTLDDVSYTLGMTEWMDKTDAEYRDYLSIHSRTSQPIILNFPIFTEEELPSEVDWRKHNAVTPVKNQGSCGSCWAFSTTGAIEGLWAINQNELVSLSEQELMDCSRSEGDMSCRGGLMDYAFQMVLDKGGICSEEDYPYKESDQPSCQKCDPVAHISGFRDVPSNNEEALLQAVAHQPVSVAIEADHLGFRFYKSGVFNSEKCGDTLDHGVLLVGYGVEDNQPYWILKNSWGTSWGDEGYMKIARNVSNPEGMCGLALQPSYPYL